MRFVTGMSVRAKAALAAAGTVAFALALCMLALVLALQHNLRDSANMDATKTADTINTQLQELHPVESKPLILGSDDINLRDGTGHDVVPAPAGETAAPLVLKDSASASPLSVTVRPSTTAVDNATGLLLGKVAPAAVGLVLFVAALTWLLVGRALRPVSAIRQEFTEITERDLHRRVPVAAARDEISQLAQTMNRTLDRLQQGMNRQRQFIADASHELRSPIAALRAQLELALARPSRTDWPTAVHKALGDTERLQAVASDLLLLARLDAQETHRRTAVDLSELAAEESQRQPRTITMSGDGGGEGPVVTGSRVQLLRLLTNLADNARRHARTRVSITVGVSDGTVELAVDDDGPGIPEADRERVFERFTRLDGARARQDGGTGLGLAIARDIARAHGGTLAIETSPWGGARLLLRLPRAQEEARVACAS
ncbi:sensor histidine kinase [Streptomyces sp. NPDC056161]|uniref:sensor histidine kinase n=1 Tax=Streptomyces sp. NPDC056161 TaxID=3345732 RepID=UPI0035DA857A